MAHDQHQHSPHQHEPETHAAAAAPGTAIDPVCGMTVKVATAKHTHEHAGATYYFCNPGCKVRFEQGGPPEPMGEVRVELKRSRR